MATQPNSPPATASALRQALDLRDDVMFKMQYTSLGKIDFLFTDRARIDSRLGKTEGVIDFRQQGPGLALAHTRRGDILLILGEWEPLPDVASQEKGAMRPCTSCLADCDECGIGG